MKQGLGGGSATKAPVGAGGGGGRHAAPAGAVSAANSFEAALESSELEQLLDRLYDISDRLSVFPSGRLLAEYRSVLTELLRRAMQGLRIKRDLRWRKTDTRALALMEEIKGCLISLLM